MTACDCALISWTKDIHHTYYSTGYSKFGARSHTPSLNTVTPSKTYTVTYYASYQHVSILLTAPLLHITTPPCASHKSPPPALLHYPHPPTPLSLPPHHHHHNMTLASSTGTNTTANAANSLLLDDARGWNSPTPLLMTATPRSANDNWQRGYLHNTI